ncbi:MAG: beta-lactamase family protein [Betaproteobacteria bacterium]|nr:beta-lactamase family protein [Betaproteobacteria bacterium]
MRPSCFLIAATLASGILSMSFASPGSETASAASLDAQLAAIADDPAYPLASLSVAALRGGKVVYERQFGRRRIDGTNPGSGPPADGQTLYRIASISKLVTTLGVLRLAEAGRLDLDRDVSVYLGYRLRNPHFPDDPVTLRMLVTHTSSLRDDAGYFWDRGHRLRDVLLPGGSLYGDGAAWARNAKPGAWFSYANLPWGVVAEVMEAATGERFDRLMKRLVLEPLGVPGGFNPAEFSRAEMANLAALYRKRETIDGKDHWQSPDGPWTAQVDDYSREAPVPRAGPDYKPGTNGTLFAPQGGLRTSAAGLARIMRMLMDGGLVDAKPFLRSETVDAMLAEQWRYDATAKNGDSRSEEGHKDLFNAWGLGNQHFLDVSGPGRGDRLVEGGGFTGVGHLGDAWGLTAIFAFNREARDGLIVLIGGVAIDPEKNRGAYSGLYRHEEKILTALYRRAIRGQ